MGIYSRPDSPWWWLWLETASSGQHRVKTKIKIGTTPLERRESKALAQAFYHQRLQEIAVQAHHLPRERPAITFDAFATWYDLHVVAHHRGVLREREILKTLRATFGPLALTALDRAAVMEWRSRRTAVVSASTTNRETALLKAMLTAAVPDYLEASPLVKLKGLHTAKRETFVLSPVDERKLLRALRVADRALVLCALDTLMRLSDVLNLRRDHDRKTYLVVVDSKVKPYKVPVSTRLRAALDRLPDRGPYFFAHRRVAEKPRDYRGSVQSMLERACLKAGIPYGRAKGGLTFHALRHTGATRLVERGVSLRIIQELGGWQSLRQLERYAHPSEAAKLAAVELIGSRLTPAQKRKGLKRARKSRAA